jgi:hypothetical protein
MLCFETVIQLGFVKCPIPVRGAGVLVKPYRVNLPLRPYIGMLRPLSDRYPNLQKLLPQIGFYQGAIHTTQPCLCSF